MKRSEFFLAIFLMSCGLELLAVLKGIVLLHQIAKPLILLSLIAYYISKTKNYQIPFVVALLACWLGDVFLLFDERAEIFFMLGLISFLIAHILFIFVFRRNREAKMQYEFARIQKIRLAFPVLLAGTGLIVMLYPLLGDLKIPVIIYSMALVTMVLTALSRLARTSIKSFRMIFGGAVLFMASDSLLAINKFSTPLPKSGISIMITYCAAVYLIVAGIIVHTAAPAPSSVAARLNG